MSDVLFEGLEARLFLSAASIDPSPALGESRADDAATPAGSSSHTRTRDIFGRDDRVRVRDTEAHPYAAVGQIDAWWPDGSGLACTGAVVGRYHVLTSAHCLYDTFDGKAGDVEFTAARDGTRAPFGAVEAAKFRIDPDYPGAESSEDDYALITLDRPLGDDTGWFGYGNYKTSAFNAGMRIHTAGYPGDLGGGNVMYRQSARTASASTYRISARIDVAVGQSGSPVYRDDNTIVGILSASSNQYAYATRITARRFHRLQKWIDKDQRKIAAKARAREAARARETARATSILLDAGSPFSSRSISSLQPARSLIQDVLADDDRLF
jgi:glutamyl endopeptidase